VSARAAAVSILTGRKRLLSGRRAISHQPSLAVRTAKRTNKTLVGYSPQTISPRARRLLSVAGLCWGFILLFFVFFWCANAASTSKQAASDVLAAARSGNRGGGGGGGGGELTTETRRTYATTGIAPHDVLWNNSMIRSASSEAASVRAR